ncbi:CrcB protein [Peribacillus huizhouensis]|uniref:Fluoride-specific ion channel FluC n=2 Tax=Bacillales TaxID=1385 RepID=A0ABR6CRL7_9BACI|nr:CrcB protein [Peribacillus huizhouensis]
MHLLAVLIGGFFGAVCRYGVGIGFPAQHGFPIGTFIINLFGCLFLGWFLTFIGQKKTIRPEVTSLIGTGFTGSFTTFSTFSVETIHLFQEGLFFLALLYVFASTILGLLFAYIGRKLALSHQQTGELL